MTLDHPQGSILLSIMSKLSQMREVETPTPLKRSNNTFGPSDSEVIPYIDLPLDLAPMNT